MTIFHLVTKEVLEKYKKFYSKFARRLEAATGSNLKGDKEYFFLILSIF